MRIVLLDSAYHLEQQRRDGDGGMVAMLHERLLGQPDVVDWDHADLVP